MGIATLTRHRLTSQSIFQGPRSPYITEREQVKDRKAGLKRKNHPPLPLWDLPCLRGGKLMANAITLFLPLRQGKYPEGGEGVDDTSGSRLKTAKRD